MTLPVFPASPPAPQRLTDDAATFNTRADAFAAWWALLPDALQDWVLGVVDAIGDANYSSVSSTSLTIGTGDYALDVASGKSFTPGQFVMVIDAADPATNWMFGQIVAYNVLTGDMTFRSLRVGGGGTKAAWLVALSGPQGEGGDVLPDFAGNANKVFAVKADETGGEWVVRDSFVIQAADRALTSTTAAQKLFDASAAGALTLPVGRYAFEAMVRLTGMSATAGNAAFHLLGAGTATLALIMQETTGVDDSVGPGFVVNPLTGSFAIAQATPSLAATSTGQQLEARIAGGFSVAAGGTIIPSLALATAAAATFKAGSYFTCRKLGTGNIFGQWS